MKAIRKRHAAKRRVDYEDRQANSIIDRVNVEQLERFTVATLCNPPQHMGVALRTRLDYLMGYSYVTRGENRRTLELADLFRLNLEHTEGPTHAVCGMVILDTVKTNNTGRYEYMGALGHKRP